MAIALITYVRPLTVVLPFKYLGRVLLESDDNWLEVIRDLLRARQKWVRFPQRNLYSMWAYHFLYEAMSESGVQEVETYVTFRQNTVAKFIATRPMMDLCLVAARHPRARVLKRWWK